MKKILSLIPFLLISCTPYKELLEEQAEIFDLNNQISISYSQLLTQLADVDIILIGEEHDARKHPKIEQRVVKDLKAKSVVVEQLNINQQPLIAVAKRLKDEALFTALAWQDWDWNHYKNLFNYLFSADLNVIPANLSHSEIEDIKAGAYPLKGDKSITPEVKRKIAALINNFHVHSPHSINKLVEIQQFRDRRMAEKLFKNTKPAVLIAGNWHTAKDIGVPLHLEDYQSNQKIKVLMLKTNTDSISNKQADFVWYTH